MTPLPDADPPAPATRRRASDTLLALARPLLGLSLALFQVEVRRSLYPRDEPVTEVDGVDPQGILFAGDIVVKGHGVLSHGLTVAAQTAFALSSATGRGVRLSTLSASDMTMAKLAARPHLGAEQVEVAFLMLGLADVLLVTRSEAWESGLRAVIERIRSESQFRAVRVVVSGIPPMSDFRPIRPAVKEIIEKQIARLDAVSREVADSIDGVQFVPFPSWRIGDMYIKQMFSWKTMHEAWAHTLAEAVAPPAAPGSYSI